MILLDTIFIVLIPLNLNEAIIAMRNWISFLWYNFSFQIFTKILKIMDKFQNNQLRII